MAIPTYSSSVITAVGRVQQGLSAPSFIMGGRGGSGGTSYQIFKKASTYSFNLFRTQLFVPGKPFHFTEARFRLSQAMAANMTITPVLVFDDGSKVVSGTVINVTNYVNSDRYIVISADNFDFNVNGNKNFYLEFRFSGTALSPIQLPIDIDVEVEPTL